MPATSIKQRRLMALAEHKPSMVSKKNRGVLSMSHADLHDFAATDESELPMEASDESENDEQKEKKVKKKKKASGLAALKDRKPVKFGKKTLSRGNKPSFDFRGRKDNGNGTVTYV